VIRSIPRAALAVLATSTLLAGCSTGDRPVARVGSHVVTVNDMIDAARGNATRYAGSPEEAKRALLDDLVNGELILEAARRRGLDTTATSRRYRDQLRDRLLLGALVDRLAPQDVGVSDAETRRFYADRSIRADARIIYSTDQSVIREAKKALDRGEAFGDVADRFNMPGMTQKGGSLGFKSPGDLLPPLDDALRTLPVGDIGGPYDTPQGWFLLTIDRREPAEQDSFANVQSQLAEMLRRKKVGLVRALAISRLREEYGVTVEKDAAARMFRLLTPARTGEGVMPPLAPEDSTAVLARWDGGTYTVGDAFDDLRRSDVAKPPAAMTPELRQWIVNQATARVARQEALRRHLEEEPSIARDLRNQFDGYLLQAEYQYSVGDVPRPDAAEVRKLWDAVKAQYPRVERATVEWLVVPDSAAAATLAMQAGGTLEASAKAAGFTQAVHRETIHYPTQDAAWAPMRLTFVRMQPGQRTGPERLADGWKVIQLVDKVQAPTEFDELPPALQGNFASNAWQMARDMRLTQFTDSLRRIVNPEEITANLRHVPWPPPPVAGTGN